MSLGATPLLLALERIEYKNRPTIEHSEQIALSPPLALTGRFSLGDRARFYTPSVEYGRARQAVASRFNRVTLLTANGPQDANLRPPGGTRLFNVRINLFEMFSYDVR